MRSRRKYWDTISESGIKFVILSPWQLEGVENERRKIMNISSNAAYGTPYILTGKRGGEVVAFFYDPGLASSISFGHG